MKFVGRPITKLAAAVLAALTPIGMARAGVTPQGKPAAPSGQVTVQFLGERTAADMANAAALQASAPTVQFNLPTMPLDEYVATKQTMRAMAAQQGKPAAPAAAATPTISTVNFPGASQGENGINAFPPDTEGAAGPSQIVQTTNSSVDVWKKCNPSTTCTGQHIKSTADTAFFGTSDFLGDQRVLYDAEFKRWVIVADDFTVSSSAFNILWIAVSKTSNPAGAWFIYTVGFSGGPFVAGNFFDFPNMGMDQDAVTFTGNIFHNSGGYVTTEVFAIAKARIYNGKGFSFPAFDANAAAGFTVGTVTPSVQIENPEALDQNPVDWFAAAPGGSIIPLFGMEFSSKNGLGTPSFFFWGNVAVPGYSLPPDATQPSPCSFLDSGDNRFSNVCRQTPPNGSFPDGTLFCAHTIALGTTFPEIEFYQLNPASLSAPAQNARFFYSGTSFDLNPSIDSDSAGDAYLTWSVTCGNTSCSNTGSTLNNPAVAFGGRKSTDPLSSITISSTLAATSAGCFGLQRWGDYSATSVDPQNFSTATNNAWIVNETVNSSGNWTSQITRLHK